MKTFTCELKDLREESFTYVTIYYEGDQIYSIEDEFEREWSTKELSIYDLNLIEKHLVLQLSADGQVRVL